MKQQLPALRPKEVITALENAGFLLKRQTGSHAILYNSDIRRPISIPTHPKDLPTGTLRAVIRQANLTVEEFLKLL